MYIIMQEFIDNIVLMKYGVHAGESSESIIQRKIMELEETGKVFWGYGGNLCHPINQVQPFLEENRRKGQRTFLTLVKTKTEIKVENQTNDNEQNRALFYSDNKVDWLSIPKKNIVTGSRFAIICKTFDKCSIDLDLSMYRIPFGNAENCRLSDFLRWRKNKACGRYSDVDMDISIPKIVNVSIIAEIENAVFVQ